jgi:hypothetical protein
MIRRSSRCLGIDTARSEFRQVEFLNKEINGSNWIIFFYPVFPTFSKQRASIVLSPALYFDGTDVWNWIGNLDNGYDTTD